MPKQRAKQLITELNERFGDSAPSPQQTDLMAQLDAHIHELGEDTPVDPSFVDAVELYLSEVESAHPQTATVIKQLVETLKNIGV